MGNRTLLILAAPWHVKRVALRHRLTQMQTDSVAKVIGVSDEEYERLKAAGHVATDYDASVP